MTTAEVITWKDARARLKNATSVRIRQQPNANSAILGNITGGQVIQYEGDASIGWWHVKVGIVEGYSSDTYFEPDVLGNKNYKLEIILENVPPELAAALLKNTVIKLTEVTL